MVPRPRRHDRDGARRAARWLLLGAALAAGEAAALDPKVPFRDYALDRWGVEHGLPQITVMSIVQDRTGYLWVGTQNGIARFDGLDFETYDRASTGIDTTMAVGGIVDRQNRVWFGTPRGALYIERHRVAEMRAADDLLSVRAVAQTIDDRLLFATERGIYTLGDEQLVPLWTVGTPTYSLQAEGDALWAGGVGWLWRISDGRPTGFALPDVETRVTQIARRGATLWLGTDRGALEFDAARGAFRRILPELAGQAIESLAVDRDGNAWIGTAAQLLRVLPDGRAERIDADDLAGQPWVLAIFEDAEGDVWLGTRRESLYRVRNSPTVVRSERDGLGDPFVWSVLADGDGLLVGTNSNLMRLDAAGRFRPLVDGARLPNASVYDLARDDDGALWLGTRGGLARYAHGRLAVPPELAPLTGLQITGVRQVGPDDRWIATMDGLFRHRAGRLETVIAPAGSAATRIRCLLALAPDELLIGTEAGVRRVRGRDVETPSWSAALEGSFVARIAEVKPGLLAIATLDAGLALVADERLLLLGLEHGLPTRNGWALDVIDDQLYVGSIVGVYRIPLAALPDPRGAAPARVPAQVIAESTGRARTLRRLACCNGGAMARSARIGRHLYYPTTNGVVRVDTGAIPRVPPPPRAVIEALHNGGTVHLAGTPLALAAPSRDVSVEFTGLSLIDSHAIEFRYRLDGYDGDWMDAGARRTAYYTHLPPGRYAFTVQARHPLGTWSAPAEPLAFEIVPRWHEQHAIRGLAALAAFAALALLWRWRVATLSVRQRELERAVVERTRELARANDRLRGANRALALENQTDALTGLYNRRHVMASQYARAGARAADRCALLLMDLDDFKHVNDRHGHASGDAVLVELAQLVARTLRDGDVVTRWGGEEFLMLLPGVELTRGLALAERVRAAVAGHGFRSADGAPLSLSCSIGVAMNPPWPGVPDAFQLALELADAALYRAKRAGRDRVAGVEVLRELPRGVLEHALPGGLEGLVADGALAWLEPGAGANA